MLQNGDTGNTGFSIAIKIIYSNNNCASSYTQNSVDNENDNNNCTHTIGQLQVHGSSGNKSMTMTRTSRTR